jgi:hypothetical protein
MTEKEFYVFAKVYSIALKYMFNASSVPEELVNIIQELTKLRKELRKPDIKFNTLETKFFNAVMDLHAKEYELEYDNLIKENTLKN